MAYRQASAFRNLELLVQNSFTRRQLSRTIVHAFSPVMAIQADVTVLIFYADWKEYSPFEWKLTIPQQDTKSSAAVASSFFWKTPQRVWEIF